MKSIMKHMAKPTIAMKVINIETGEKTNHIIMTNGAYYMLMILMMLELIHDTF